jgi:uncharacterized coiled-coil protein SlyX
MARTNKPTTVPGIPKPPADVSPALRKYLESVTEAVEIRLGRRGDPRDRAITLRELIDSGLATELSSRPFVVGQSGDPGFGPDRDTTTPTAPTNFSATGGYAIVTVFWDYPNYGPHSHTEIWRHDQNIIGDAQLVGISSGISFVDPVGEGASYYYWARHVSLYDVYGPYNAVSGTLAQTALNVQLLLSELTNAISASQLTQELASQIDGAGTAADLANLEAFVGYFSNYSGSSLKVLVDEANQGVTDLETYTGYVTGYAGSNLRTRISQSETNIIALSTTVNDPVTGVSANAGALSALDTRVTATEGSITTQSGQITTINSSLTSLTNSTNANTSAISGLTTRVTAAEGEIDANTSDITALETTVNNPSTGVAATANAVSSLTSRVTTAEGTITSQGTSITNLQSGLTSANSNISANGSSISALDSRVTSAEGTITSQGTSITNLQSGLTTANNNISANGSSISALDSRVTSAEGTITSQGTSITSLQNGLTTANNNIAANSSSLSGLDSRVTTAENTISSQGTSITALQNGLSSANSSISANSSAITSLNSRVTSAEGSLSSQSSAITALQNTVSSQGGSINANASNISSLTTRVTSVEGVNSSQASSINTLNTTVNGHTASIQTNTSSINGLNAKYVVKIDNNGAVAGFGLASTANSAGNITSEFIVNADRFAILRTATDTGTPLVPFIVTTSTEVINGVSVPPGVYIADAFIRNGTITNAKIGNGQIDDAKIGSLNANKITAGTIDTARLAIDNVTLDSYYDSSIQRNRLRIRDLGVDTAKIANAAITFAKIGNAEVGTLKIAGNAITQPETYGASDVYVTSPITVSSGGYIYVGPGNGDYIYEPEFGGYFFVGAGNGDYALTSGGALSGGHVAIETPQINVGIDSTAALQAVFYAFCDGSLVNDGGQILYMQVNKFASGSWSGYQTVATSRVGARTGGGNTQSVFSIAMAHTAINLQNIRIKVLVGSQAVQAPPGVASNPTYLRNIAISVLGAKR